MTNTTHTPLTPPFPLQAKERKRVREEQAAALTLSQQFMADATIEELPPQAVLKPRVKTSILKLNNNSFTKVDRIIDILNDLLWAPQNLTFIDLSFNDLVRPPQELDVLKGLQLLYLHGNKIKSLSSLRTLST